MEVIGTPEFNDLEGCPNTFGNIVYEGEGLLEAVANITPQIKLFYCLINNVRHFH